jgi:hypothetical protein
MMNLTQPNGRLGGATKSGSSTADVLGARGSEQRDAILESSITLIQRASLQPGGREFDLAIQKLNQYFEGTPAIDYQLDSAARTYLLTQFPPELVEAIQQPRWVPRDTRHVEDCMMYYTIANRVAGAGDDVSRAARLFNWVVQQVQLVPAGSLRSPQLPHVYARPYDVLLRGMATESDGFWAERAWVFLSLCRQLGFDAGLITYQRSNRVESPLTRRIADDPDSLANTFEANAKAPIVWICAVLIDDQAYLFDARVGLPIPGPGGKGVATLEQAITDPSVLEQMNLPGQSPYGTSLASLRSSSGQLGILIDSGLGYFSPKMKLLQEQLAGKNRTILYRDPAQQRDHFVSVLGDRLGQVSMWSLPLEVETKLFTDGTFVQATQQALVMFRQEFPLIYARVKQLRGELDQAVQEYVNFRFSDHAMLVTDKDKPIPRPLQDGLDVYATYFLGLAHLERGRLDQAERMFVRTLDMLPEPGANEPYFLMFRWGANANLGRIYEAKGDIARAIAHYTQGDPTMQHHGNLLKARELVWQEPTLSQTVSLPPAPTTFGRKVTTSDPSSPAPKSEVSAKEEPARTQASASSPASESASVTTEIGRP